MTIEFRDVPGPQRSDIETGDGDAYRRGRIAFGRCRLDDVMHGGDFCVEIRRVTQVVVWWVADGRVEATRDGVTDVAEPGELLLLPVGNSPLRIRLVAVKNCTHDELTRVPPLLSGTKDHRVVLELDYWILVPRR